MSTCHQLQHLRLGELKRWERNYRVGDVEAIAKSIVRFGFNGALKVWRGTVMSGNHALIALQTMRANGASAPLGISSDDKDWIVPCINVSHLSWTEAEAYAIADNRTQERGQNDPERLAKLLAEIVGDPDLSDAVGVNQGDVDRLIAQIAKEQEFEPESAEGQGKLDTKAKTICPECGYEFP